MIEIDIPDIKLIQQKIKKIAGPEQRKVATVATRKMALEYKRELKQAAPKDTGNLRRFIKHSVKRARSRNGVNAKVGLLGKDRKNKDFPYYAYFIERGTSGHSMRERKGKATDTKYMAIGDGVYSNADHPGVKAKPFIRPTFIRNRRRAVKTGSRHFIDEIRKRWK